MTDVSGLDDLLTLRRVAEMAGLQTSTMRAYHDLSMRARKEGRTLPATRFIPEPDVRIGHSILWKRETAETWVQARDEALTGRTSRRA